MEHKPDSTEEEPITERIKKAIDTQFERHDRRTSDKRFEYLKPYLIYLICGIIAAGLAMWREQALHSEEITAITTRLTNLELEARQINELASENKANDAKHEELNYWRRTIETRLNDIAALLIEHTKEKNPKEK